MANCILTFQASRTHTRKRITERAKSHILSVLTYIIYQVCTRYFIKGQTPASGIPPSYHATRRYTKVHLGFCLRFSTLIGLIGRVPLFGAGPRRYIRLRLFRLAVTAFWRAFTASWRQKGKRKEIFPRAELPSNPSPLTFRNNQIQILQTSSTHATMAANVFQQDTNTHGTRLSHARTRQSFFDTTHKKWSEWKKKRSAVIP